MTDAAATEPQDYEANQVMKIGMPVDGGLLVGLLDRKGKLQWYAVDAFSDRVEFKRADCLYIVRPSKVGGKWSCTCPDSRFRRHRCKHELAAEVLMMAALVFEGGPKFPRAYGGQV